MDEEQEREPPPPPPMFFKVVRNLSDDGMDFPAIFEQWFSAELGGQTRAKLSVPEAEPQFRVTIGRADYGRVWIHEGLRRFTEFYRLSVNDYLFFKYVGRATFHVTIFDRSTATEINYPVREDGPAYDPRYQPQFYHVVEGDAILQQGLRLPDRFVQRYGRNRLRSEMKLVDPYDRQGWRVRCIMDIDGRVWLTGARFRGFLNFYGIGDNTVLLIKAIRTSRLEVTMFRNDLGSEIDYPMRTPLERATAFRSDYPYFISAITEGMLVDSVTVPVAFAREHFDDRVVGQHEMVRLLKGRRAGIQVRLSFEQRKTRLRSGWPLFARMNHVVAENVCVFEWRQHEEAFRVYIYR